MAKNLLKKLIITSFVATALSGCGESDGNQKLYPKDLKPVVIEQPKLELSFNEDVPVTAYDMLTGVENPSDSVMYPREFTYYQQELDDEGQPVLDENGNPIWLFEGPQLPVKAVLSSTNFMLITPDLLKDLLVHPHTVEQNPDLELYSQGVYKFSYVVDNGASETVRRDVTITINAVEVKAESIEFVTAEGFEVPEMFDIQLVANLLPTDTTYNKMTYESSDTSVATVSATGLVTGVSLGDFSITVTSEDGSIMNTLAGKVVPLTDPVGVEIIEDASVPPADAVVLPNATAYAGNDLDLDYQLLPASIDWSDRDVTWSVSDESKISIDDMGVVKVVSYQDLDPEAADYDPTINQAMVTATITADPEKTFNTTVTLDVANILFNGNPNWDKPWDDTIIKARDEADQTNEATFSIVDDADSIDGPSLRADSTVGDLRLRFNAEGLIHHTLDNTLEHKLSFDVHLISGKFQSFLNAQGSGWKPWPTDWSKVSVGDYPNDMFRVEHSYPASKIITNGTMYFNLHVTKGAVFYIDNMRLEEVPAQ